MLSDRTDGTTALLRAKEKTNAVLRADNAADNAATDVVICQQAHREGRNATIAEKDATIAIARPTMPSKPAESTDARGPAKPHVVNRKN